MKKGSQRSKLISLLLLGVTVGSAFAAPHLRVSTADGTVLFDIPLQEPYVWVVEWNHSVTGIVVDDYYAYDGEHMILTASHAPSFDAGLGHIPGRGTVESDANHGYWIRGINEPVPGNAYLLRVGSAAVNHRIIVGGKVYSLSAVAERERVRLEVVK
ncbi:MAG TPA: DUF1850 domain-containing protein [Chloroflexota bacterium]|nr:DUF1850 domain-containing protein [Chloroflexota bacterium]